VEREGLGLWGWCCWSVCVCCFLNNRNCVRRHVRKRDRGKMSAAVQLAGSDCWTRKTKRGNVVSVLRERYLRSDLGCRSALCRKCPAPATAAEVRLSAAPAALYVAFDSVVALACAPFLEAQHPALDDLVLLETVADDVRERAPSLRAYARLRALTKPLSGKRCVFLPNEHSLETFVPRARGEAAAHRAVRAVFAATAWLASHLDGAVRVVLLCEDPLLRAVAAEAAAATATPPPQVELLSLQEFAAVHAPQLAALAESLAAAAASAVSAPRRKAGGAGGSGSPGTGFTAYLGAAAVAAGLQAGTLLRGKLHVSAHNANEAEVRLVAESRAAAGGVDEVLVIGRDAMNRAFHGDEVAVELLPKELWS